MAVETIVTLFHIELDVLATKCKVAQQQQCNIDSSKPRGQQINKTKWIKLEFIIDKIGSRTIVALCQIELDVLVTKCKVAQWQQCNINSSKPRGQQINKKIKGRIRSLLLIKLAVEPFSSFFKLSLMSWRQNATAQHKPTTY